MDIDYVAMCIGYTMMATGAVILLGLAVYYAAYVGNMAHWKLVNHMGGYKALMEFKAWRERNDEEGGTGAG